MPSEQILFNKGLAYDSRSNLQGPGYLQTAKNITFLKDGEQGLRTQFTDFSTVDVGGIQNVERFRDLVLIADSTNLRYRSSGAIGAFTTLGSSFTDDIWTWREYKNFFIGVNGTDSYMLDSSGNLYPTVIANPTTAATLTATGVAGNPNGTYIGYVTYLITFPNGATYETGLSTGSSDVSPASKTIDWTAIPICPYTATSGTAPTIHRKLYRGPGTGGTLADIYLVATIENNTATTYDDEDVSDTQLAANGSSYVDDYTTGPVFKYHVFHYGRWLGISNANPNRLYYSEAVSGSTSAENESLMPLAFESENWDDIRTAGYGRVNPQGLIAWGTYVYIPLKHTWIKKQGNDPTSWSYKKTWAEHGIAAPYSIALCGNPIGVLGVAAPLNNVPGISLFNGQTTQIVSSPKFNYIFESDMDLDNIDQCKGLWDGRYYHLIYPCSDTTQVDRWAAFDMSRFPDIRLAMWEDLDAESFCVDRQSTKFYIGSSGGTVSQNSGTETINMEVITHDLIGGQAEASNVLKTLKQLKYALDTGGDDITLEIYLDGTLGKWPNGSTTKTISGTNDKIQVLPGLPTDWEAYEYTIRIYGSGLSTFKLYSPWTMEFDTGGL